MATKSQTRPRPLSPHLFAWRPGVHMIVSIVHRITGSGMALVGTVLLVWWLAAVAAGEASYGQFRWLFADVGRGAVGYILGIALSWAFFQHLASGVRHLVLDTGAGYELTTNKRWAWFTFGFSIVATAVFWGYLLGVK